MATSRFAILGSGASTCSPWLQCLISKDNGCPICKEADTNPESHNNRNNVSAVVSHNHPNGKQRHVMIDAGKTMRQTIAKCFPKLGIHDLDAVLLTHPHADAYLGLDDLRDVSPRKPLPVYLTEGCFKVVSAAFPYLTAHNGKVQTFVARLDWRIITPWVPFDIPEAGLIVTPIPVQHGPTPNDVSMSFEIGACLPYSPSPAALVAASPPETGESAPPSSVDAGHVPASRSPSSSPPPVDNARPAASSAWPGSALVPFALPAFNGSRILYVSDVNAISSEVRAYFLSRPTDLLILDCLNYRQYSTHFCMLQSVNCALDIRAKVTRFVGMNHRIDHELEHGFLQAWGRALPGQLASHLQQSIAIAADASATNAGASASALKLHSSSCGADVVSRVDHYVGGPLDIGLAHDGQPFAVSIDHTTTLQQVDGEVQAVLRYVASQKHTPASADDPVPSPSDSNAYSKAAAGDGCACNNDRDGNSVNGGDGKAAHSISSTSSGAAPVSASSASAAAATSPSPAGAIPAAAAASKVHSAHSYLHSHVKSLDPAAEGSFSPSADAIAVGRQQHPPSWKPEAGARAGAETDSAAHQAAAAAAAAAAADSSGSGGAASTNGVAARGSGSGSNSKTKAATMPGPGGEVRLSTAGVTRAETDHYDYLHPQRPEFDDANSPTVVKLLQGWSFK